MFIHTDALCTNYHQLRNAMKQSLSETETTLLQNALRDYLVQSRKVNHVLVRLDLAQRLKSEMNCSWKQLPQKTGIKGLAVVYELDKDFVIL